MQVRTLLHNTLFNSLKNIHKTRLKALISTVASLLNQGKLTLIALDRNMGGESFVKPGGSHRGIALI